MTAENPSPTSERDRRASGPLGRLLWSITEGTELVGTTPPLSDTNAYRGITKADLQAGGEAVQDLLAEIAQENKSSQA